MSDIVTYDIQVSPKQTPKISAQQMTVPNVKINKAPDFFKGATFTPIITFPNPTKIRFEWTNDQGLPNPEPMEFDIPMGNGDMIKAVYDINDDGIVDKAENAINAENATNALKVNNFKVLRTVLANEYTNEQIDDLLKITGDMKKSVYDTNDNGIVDNTEALSGHSYDEIKKMIDDAYYQRYATVNYKGTTIHANNSLKRNLVDENTKIEVLGQTIQNLVDDSNIWKTEQTVSTESASNVVLSACGKEHFTKSALKPSTKYTVFFDYEIKNNTLENYYFQCNQIISGVTQTSVFAFNKDDIDNNLKLKTFTTSNAFTGLIQIYFGGRKGSATFKNNGFMILEGDWTNKEVSYVPFGLNYPKTTEVVEIGKNWNSTVLESGAIIYETGEPIEDSSAIRTKDFIEVVPNKKYIISKNGEKKRSNIFYYDKDKKFIKLLDNTSYDIFTTDNNVRYVKLTWGTTSTTVADLIQIELGDNATEYEAYTERRININKPLASISDTIRDRYYVKNGKKYHEQVIDIFELNGDNWTSTTGIGSNVPTGYTRFSISNIQNLKKVGLYNLKCSNLALAPSFGDTSTEVGISGAPASGLLYIRLKNDMLTSLNESGIRKWLNENPLKILYELATPITTEIETEDWYSFNEQTNITTTNTVKPTLDIDIPSNLNAVTSNLIAENMALKQENQMLSNELENQASSIETQQANLDYVSMMTGVEL